METQAQSNELNTGKIMLVALALITVFLFVGNVRGMDFTSSEKSALKAGKTVRKPLASSGENGFYGGSAFTVIDAPVDAVWNALFDWSVYDETFAATVEVREVATREDHSLIHYKMGYKFITLEYYLDIERDESKYMMSFSLVESRPHDISSSKGYWRLFPQKDGRTLVAYVVAAKIPMGVFNMLKPGWKDMVERNLIGAPNDVRKLLASPKGQKYYLQTAKK